MYIDGCGVTFCTTLWVSEFWLVLIYEKWKKYTWPIADVINCFFSTGFWQDKTESGLFTRFQQTLQRYQDVEDSNGSHPELEHSPSASSGILKTPVRIWIMWFANLNCNWLPRAKCFSERPYKELLWLGIGSGICVTIAYHNHASKRQSPCFIYLHRC